MLRNATSRIGIAGISLSLWLAGLGMGWAQTSSLTPEVVVYPSQITVRNMPSRNPDIAVSPGGLVTVVAESGPVDAGRLGIVKFSYREGVYAEPLALSGPGDCRTPRAVYDQSGTLHLVWCERRGDTYGVRYAWQTAEGQWNDGGTISQTPNLDCEFPQVAVDNRTGRVWAAWQAGVGTRYGIYLAWRDSSSSFTVLNVTGEASDHRHLRPQLFPQSPYLLVWYEEWQDAFLLRAVFFDSDSGEFRLVSPLDFDRFDVRKTPEIFQAPSGLLGGVWTDLVGGRNRVLVGLQDPTVQGEGLVVDTTPSGETLEPAAVAVGEETVALAWVNREPIGSAIYVGRLDGTSKVTDSLALQVPQSVEDDAVSRPRLAVGPRRMVHCVWFSDASRGGTGALYYTVLLF